MFRMRRKVDKVAVLFQTTQNDIAVRELIKEAKEMEFDTDRAARLKALLCKLCYYRGGRIAGQAFTEWNCAVCGKADQHPNTATPVVCADCAKEHSLCRDCGADLELRTKRRKFNFPKKEEASAEAQQ